MTDDPVDLDERRGMVAQKATEVRRQQLHDFQANQAALRRQQEELEKLLLAAPSETWLEVAAKAQYLIQLFAATPEAQDPRRIATAQPSIHEQFPFIGRHATRSADQCCPQISPMS